MPNMALFDDFVIWRIKQIQIEVDIDTSGRVTAARLLNPDENLSAPVSAALIAAAKGWTFEPARMGDQNVPAKHTIVFHFPQS
jgi:TonB family protein